VNISDVYHWWTLFLVPKFSKCLRQHYL
jgi:hypothetical protein